MVMSNRRDGSGAPHWWDDLPPHIRDRFAQPLAPAAEPEGRAADAPAPLGRRELLGDLSRLAVLFVLIAIGNVLFLLVALSFVSG